MRSTKLAMLAGIGTAVLAATMAAPASAGVLPCFLTNLGCDRAPEIDPTLLRGALTVLVGGGLMLAERFRKH